MGMLNHLTCPLRNLNVGQEATVRTRHGTTRHGTTRYGTTDWFKIGKEVWQGCILLPFLFNLYAEYIMWNSGLDESQAEIQNAGRNISNLRYADDTTLMGRKWRGNKASWWGWERMKKLAWKSIFKKLRSRHLVPSLYGKYRGKKWKQWQILSSWAPKLLWMMTTAMKLKEACFLEGKLWQTWQCIKNLTKIPTVKAMVFPLVMYGCEWELDYKESWMSKNCCFWTVVLEKTQQGDQTSQF